MRLVVESRRRNRSRRRLSARTLHNQRKQSSVGTRTRDEDEGRATTTVQGDGFSMHSGTSSSPEWRQAKSGVSDTSDSSAISVSTQLWSCHDDSP